MQISEHTNYTSCEALMSTCMPLSMSTHFVLPLASDLLTTNYLRKNTQVVTGSGFFPYTVIRSDATAVMFSE